VIKKKKKKDKIPLQNATDKDVFNSTVYLYCVQAENPSFQPPIVGADVCVSLTFIFITI